MSIEILDCLKRKRDICVKNTIPSQNTAFMWIPALVIYLQWNVYGAFAFAGGFDCLFLETFY